MTKLHRITADMFQAAMPFPKLMCCLDKPTYPEMVVICKEIYQNLTAILLPFGIGHARYLGSMMLEALHVQHFNDPFKPPINPSKYSDNIPTNASAQ